jgi:hypothetical protein
MIGLAANAVRSRRGGKCGCRSMLSGKSGGKGALTPKPPDHNATCVEVCIMAIPSVPRCAVCGRRGQSLFSFVLLAEACRKFNVRLKVPSSTVFHEPCSRKAYAALTRRPVVSFLQGGIK